MIIFADSRDPNRVRTKQARTTVNEAGKDDILVLLHHNNQLNKMKFTNSSIGENSNISLLIKRNYF